MQTVSRRVVAGVALAGLFAAAGGAGLARPAERPAARAVETEAAMVRLYARHGHQAAARSAGADLLRTTGMSGFARLAAASGLYHGGDVEGAAALYRAMLADDPRAPLALFNLGCALDRMNRPDEAAEAWLSAARACGAALPRLAAACAARGARKRAGGDAK